MNIKSLKLQNFKIFSDVSITLDGKSTVIFGENGSGKTSVLSAINILSWNWIYRICLNQGTAFRSINSDMVRTKERFLEISAVFSLEDEELTLRKKYTKATTGGHGTTDATSKKLYDSFTDTYKKLFAESDLPIMVNYGTNRSVLSVPLRIRKKHVFDKWSAFDNALENTLDFRTFFEWIRNREDYELERKVDKQDFTYKDPLLECVRKALLAMLDGFTDLRVRRSPLRLTIKKNGIEFSIDQLSDGEKCTLALFGDLARRLGIANPGLANPLEGRGIVLIDEIELHMHPAWQRKVLGALKSTFPNIQFIVTTHSPQVLGEADERFNIIKLNADGSFNIMERLDGYDANAILEEKMGTDIVSRPFRDRVDNVYSLIDQGRFDEADVEIKEIKSITDENSQTVIQMEGSLKLARALHEKNRKSC